MTTSSGAAGAATELATFPVSTEPTSPAGLRVVPLTSFQGLTAPFVIYLDYPEDRGDLREQQIQILLTRAERRCLVLHPPDSS